MDMKLERKALRADGIFSELQPAKGHIFYVAEHAYDSKPKLPDGTYTCKRGQHRLHSGPVEAFEVLNVPGHTGILLHVGNFPQIDSDGCILLGMACLDSSRGRMVTQSKEAFAEFMALQAGVDTFIF